MTNTIEWDGHNLPLFDHPYNATITNERAVELAIAKHWLASIPSETDGLEVGNVLGHYGPASLGCLSCVHERRIIDRYEHGPGVENLDVFELGGQYDWIISISTLEHVRRAEDEPIENRMGGVAALYFLRGLLKPGGKMLVTVGLGQNGALDAHLYAHGWIADRSAVFVRGDGSWTPVALSTAAWREYPYGPAHGANAVWIGEWGPR